MPNEFYHLISAPEKYNGNSPPPQQNAEIIRLADRRIPSTWQRIDKPVRRIIERLRGNCDG